MTIFFSSPLDQDIDPRVGIFSISATNTSASFPASNLLTYDPTQVMMTTSGSTVILVQALDLPLSFNLVSVIYSNVSSAATLKIEFSLNNVTWTQLYNGAFWAHHAVAQTYLGAYVPGDVRSNSLQRNLSLWHQNSGVEANYLRLTITDPSTTNMTFGRLFLGKKFVPETGWQIGSSISFSDPSSRKERTDQGALILYPGKTLVSATVKMDFLSKEEMYNYIWNFNYWRGSSREILACLDVEDTVRLQKNTLYCTIAEGRQITHDGYNIHSQTWTLESIA